MLANPVTQKAILLRRGKTHDRLFTSNDEIAAKRYGTGHDPRVELRGRLFFELFARFHHVHDSFLASRYK